MLEVGHVARSHGLRGELLISFSTDLVAERSAPGSVLFIDDIDYTVMSSRPHQKHVLVMLSGIDDREAADRLRGKKIYAEAIEDEGLVFVHEVIGARLVDQYGTDHGSVVSVIDNPASDLMELATGQLVPFSFYVSLESGVVRVEVPPGLLDDHAISERDQD